MRLSHVRAFAPGRSAAAHVIRPIGPEDESDLQQFVRDLSPASRHARFMVAMRELPEYMLDRFVHPQPGREAVLVATSPVSGIVGLVQYVADETGDGCEVALVVTDAWQRKGLGTELLNTVANVASENSIAYFHADVLADNYPMRALARKVGCEVRVNPEAHYLVEISKAIKSRADETGVVIYQ
jgi:acetyltransferase